MPVYFLVGPAAALIGIVAILFVMRNRQTQQRSMYSSRRSQIERKVRAQRQRTLAPKGRSEKPPTDAEIAAAAPVYQAPAQAPRQAWETPATPPPPPAEPAYAPPPEPAYAPPPAPEYAPPAPDFGAAAGPVAPVEPAPFGEPSAAPEWTPSPAPPEWTPTPAPADYAAAPEPAVAPPAPEPVSSPAGGGASWEVVGAPKDEAAASEPAKDKKKAAQQGSPWQLASGDAPTEGQDGDEEAKKPSAAMALAQYAVLVVGLVMVLIGVLVMVANSKVT